jgi:4-hydroxybenzoate polyprenyltransferase
MTTLKQDILVKAPYYLALIRFNRPIGTYLLLWPTLWALWIAAEGLPDLQLLFIFIAGTFLMRSAGCVINDIADRNIDGQVKRTSDRPLVEQKVTTKNALIFCLLLCLAALALVLLTNTKTILLSLVAVALSGFYPFMKRYTYFPQVVLGAAFSWGIPMAFAAQQNNLPANLWFIYAAVVLWTVAYDTFYAMVDRDDDIHIGVKSTAILFGHYDRLITAALQTAVIILLVIVGQQFNLGNFYYLSLAVATLLFIYQQYLIRDRVREKCLQAFLNSHWVGASIFIGIFLDFIINKL